MKKRSPHRRSDAKLALHEVNQWVFSPRHGLSQLVEMGRIDEGVVVALHTLAELVHVLGWSSDSPFATEGVFALVGQIYAGDSVDFDEIASTQAWIDRVARKLLNLKRTDYQVAIRRLIELTEQKTLLAQLEQEFAENLK
ncbi:hypothetical protein [Chitinimonas koreensis]|nr:hypothetical protein [Chitinimonas koreensis]